MRAEPPKKFVDPLERKQKAFAARKIPKKKFGERASKKTNISYAASSKCKKLTEFGGEDAYSENTK